MLSVLSITPQGCICASQHYSIYKKDGKILVVIIIIYGFIITAPSSVYLSVYLQAVTFELNTLYNWIIYQLLKYRGKRPPGFIFEYTVSEIALFTKMKALVLNSTCNTKNDLGALYSPLLSRSQWCDLGPRQSWWYSCL